MTEKELHRLRRQDLLQLLLSQGKEALALQTRLSNTSSALIQTKAGYDRLKEKLNEKDTLIEKLKSRLDAKDARIGELKREMDALRLGRKIQIEEAGSIAEAALRLNGIFEAAQKAADQYLYNLQRMSDERVADLFDSEDFLELSEQETGEGFGESEDDFLDLEEELSDLGEEKEPRNADE